MECDMSWSRSRTHHRVGAVDTLQRVALQIETIHEHPIGAEVGGQHKAVGRIGDDAVGVRLALSIRDRSVSGVLDDGRRLS